MSALPILDAGTHLVVPGSDPARRNPLGPDTYAAIHEATARAAAEPRIGAVVLAPEGYFCAGGDLRQLATRAALPPAARRERIEALHDTIRTIRACPRPVIAAVEGGAAGAGMSLAFACDLVVAARDAQFALSYVRAGLVPDGGATASLAALLPPPLLARLALTGAPIDAARLDALGALSALSEPGGARAAAEALAARLAEGPAEAQAAIKRLLAPATLEAALRAERDAMTEAQGGPEAAEGIAAFLEKRPADFRPLREGP